VVEAVDIDSGGAYEGGLEYDGGAYEGRARPDEVVAEVIVPSVGLSEAYGEE
jgi:hypothetical protein